MKIGKRTLAALVAGMLAAAPAQAEELHYNIAEFDESASVRVPNDTMSVVLRVQETAASRQAASNRVTERLNAVLARAKANKDFETESGNRSVYPQYDDKHAAIKAWTDTAEIRVKSRDFGALAKLAADSQKEAMLDGVSFSVSPKKYAAAVEEASEKALQAFRRRAQSVSRSLGFSGYKIVRVQLTQSFENSDEGMGAALYAAAPMEASLKSRAAPVMDTDGGMREIRQSIRGSVQMQ